MLVLTRKKDESILINGNIEIIVTDVRGGKVRIGIKAPRDVSIVRRELSSGEVPAQDGYNQVLNFIQTGTWNDVPVS